MSESQRPEPEVLPPGTAIQGLVVEALIGRGGMGEVYRAFDPELDRRVAVKLLRPEVAAAPGFVARFQREARTASAIRHPNLAQIHFAGVHDGRPFYVMELVEGSSLADLLAPGKRVGGRRALLWLIQACEGLRAAWQEGIVHRDIKPANLLLTAAGEVKIVDFGLARSVKPGSSSMTQPFELFGTPSYVAPEQVLGREADDRADMYSLGATFYHLFAGEPPFTADGPTGVLVQHVERAPVPLARCSPAVPPALGAIIDRLLAKRPEDRYADYDALLSELEAAARGPATATQAAPARRTGFGEWLRMPVVWLAATLLLVPVVVLVIERAGGEPDATETLGKETAALPARPAAAASRRAPQESAAVAPAAEDLVVAPELDGTPFADPGTLLELAQNHPYTNLAWESQSLANLRRLATAVEVWSAEHEGYPDSLEEIAEPLDLHPQALLDGWGEAIRYQRTAEGYRLRSAGSDRAFGSADDLVLEDGYVVRGGPRPPQ